MADRTYWSYSSKLHSWRAIGAKLDVWTILVVPVALFGCCSWHLTSRLLHRLRSWELRHLRRAFRLIRRVISPATTLEPAVLEQVGDYQKRTARLITKWFLDAGLDLFFVRMLKSVHAFAYMERQSVLRSGRNPLREARDALNRLWWEGMKDAPATKRRSEKLTFFRTGPLNFWEDVFVTAFGLDWRSRLQEAQTKTTWKLGLQQFLEANLRAAHLPVLQLVRKPKTPSVPVPKLLPPCPPPFSPHSVDQVLLDMPRRIRVLVDNQALALVMSGRTPLSDNKFLQSCRDIDVCIGLSADGLSLGT